MRRLTRLSMMRRLWCDASVSASGVGFEFGTWTSSRFKPKPRHERRKEGSAGAPTRGKEAEPYEVKFSDQKLGQPTVSGRALRTPRRLRRLKNEARRAPWTQAHRVITVGISNDAQRSKPNERPVSFIWHKKADRGPTDPPGTSRLQAAALREMSSAPEPDSPSSAHFVIRIRVRGGR